MKIISTNRKASFEYFLMDKFLAGIVLVGSEAKSLRTNKVNLEDCYVIVRGTNVYLKNMYIKAYDKATSFAPDEKRDRKLLLNKKEILKIARELNDKDIFWRKSCQNWNCNCKRQKALWQARNHKKKRTFERKKSSCFWVII